jgi:hypothetical protein
MAQALAECLDCQTEALHNNAPSTMIPRPIYGWYGMGEHAGHNVHLINADALRRAPRPRD